MSQQPPSDLRVFITQLRRRRVIRVAGVYLVGAFALIQGANAALDMAGAPAWVARVVLALIVLGFPVAVALAWAFDLTPGGIARTRSGAAPPEVDPSSGEVAPAGGAPVPAGAGVPGAQRYLRFAFIGVPLVLLIAASAWFGRVRGGENTLDPAAMLILPFQTAADESLGYLREGMVDLLAASLSGEVGPRVVDPRTALAAWRRAVAREDVDLTAEEALGIARGMGAGQLLLGGAVGTPARLMLNASIYDATNGDIRTRVSAEGPADSLPAMVDRLVAQLLTREAGVPRHQLEALTTTSLPALRLFLDGERNYRRGRYGEAAKQLEEALRQDSTFALAAMRLVAVAGWGNLTAEPGASARALRLAWAARERLSELDRLYLEALAGPRYPDPTPRAELRQAIERALDAMPDRPEAHFRLGFFHVGQVVREEEGAAERSHEWFRRALELDSTFAPALYQVSRHAVRVGDTAAVRVLAQRYLSADSTSETADVLRWFAAAVSGDEQRILDVRARMPGMHPTGLGWIANQAMLFGIDLDGAEAALAALRASARSQRERFNQYWREIEFLGNRGRIRDVRVLVDSLTRREGPPPFLAVDARHWERFVQAGSTLIPALYYGADTAGIAAAVGEYEAVYRDPPPPTDPDNADWRGFVANIACDAARARSAIGQPALARPAVARLHELLAGDSDLPLFMRRALTACAATAEAMIAQLEDRPEALALAERADSLLRADPPPRWSRNENQLMLARVFDALGEPATALRVLRRRDLNNPAFFLATILAEEGELAARVGDREGAVRAYTHYLTLQTDPDPELEPRVQRARSELAALLGEGT
jgi:tetratricopeptide (TPR) repeat protein